MGLIRSLAGAGLFEAARLRWAILLKYKTMGWFYMEEYITIPIGPKSLITLQLSFC